MSVDYVVIQKEYSGQRLDNYLLRTLKGVPKSRIYRAIRGGEVRINKKRCKAEVRLEEGDILRVPPLRCSEEKVQAIISPGLAKLLESRILIENKNMMVINKPAGIPVHGGSNVKLGLIEALRQLRPHAKLLELVHRLDRDTSGCLMIAKKRSELTRLQQWLTSKQMKKRYWALVKGQWQGDVERCDLPLAKNQLESGERMVKVDYNGKKALTIFRPLKVFKDVTLVEATLKTGRTHQIRVHLQNLGYPIACDDKYGDREFNKSMKAQGLTRMFLQSIEIAYRDHEHLFGVCSLLDDELSDLLSKLERF
jgi:23S rRNA pseudouridine955/2504/2580 synthase